MEVYVVCVCFAQDLIRDTTLKAGDRCGWEEGHGRVPLNRKQEVAVREGLTV